MTRPKQRPERSKFPRPRDDDASAPPVNRRDRHSRQLPKVKHRRTNTRHGMTRAARDELTLLRFDESDLARACGDDNLGRLAIGDPPNASKVTHALPNRSNRSAR